MAFKTQTSQKSRRSMVARRALTIALAALLTIALAVAVAGCGDSKESTSDGGEPTTETGSTPILIAADSTSRLKVKKDSVFLISGDSTLRSLYRRVTGEKSGFGWSTTNFQTNLMYGIQLKPTRGAESVEVSKVEQGDNEVIVHAVRLDAGPECETADELRNPYAVYETGPFRGTPRLELTTAIGSSCDGN